MTDNQTIALSLPLVAAGYFAMGYMFGMRRDLYWRTKWIELEHDTARKLGKEPRNIKEVEPK